MKPIEIEICAYSLASCAAARAGGARRIELCAAPAEGGTTPSAAAIRMARRIPDLELSVMIRPRGGDFLYTETEFEQMRQEIRFARDCGADGVVIGLLTPDGRIDVPRTAALVAEAAPMAVTFHRAFDMTRDLHEALEDVIAAGCRRILTSGGCNTAPEGIGMLRTLVTEAAGRIAVMAGSGIRPDNARAVAGTGVDALHLSARKFRESGMHYRKTGISMGGCEAVPEYGIYEADTETIRAVTSQFTK